MIAAVATFFDQAQRLFGRGFLIAGFVPSVIAITAGAALLRGVGELGDLVNAWAREPAKAVFQIGLTLVGIYLLSYVLYGIRGGLNRVFQGFLPRPLGHLERLLRWRQGRALRRQRRALARLEAAIDDAAWPAYDFEPTWVETSLTAARLPAELAAAIGEHERLEQALTAGRPIEDEHYRRLLARARMLQFAAAADPPRRVEAGQLVATLRRSYQDQPALQAAAGRISDRALRDWTVAQGEFTASFPESERWLRPTRLGNLVGALDYAVLKRYGITLGDLWPRLVHVVTEDVRTRVEDANVYLDFTVMSCFLSAVTAGVAVASIPTGPHRGGLLQAVLVAVPLLACWSFYRMSMSATRAFAEQVRAAVDLFRLELLDAMSIKRPGKPTDEPRIWNELQLFIAQGDSPGPAVRFTTEPAPQRERPNRSLLEAWRRWWHLS